MICLICYRRWAISVSPAYTVELTEIIFKTESLIQLLEELERAVENHLAEWPGSVRYSRKRMLDEGE